MAMEYTEEQLNNFDKTTLVQLFLVQQSQLRDIDQKLQLLLEQAAVLNNNRFGKSSEKLGTENQISFLEVDGNIIYFNEAEAIDSLAEYEDNETTKPRGRKAKGKRLSKLSYYCKISSFQQCGVSRNFCGNSNSNPCHEFLGSCRTFAQLQV